MCKVKFCGMRRKEDILHVNALRPDYIGYVFAESRRRVTPFEAREMNHLLNREIGSVGVFVNQGIEEIAATVEFVRLQVIQLHGEETNDMIAALRKKLPGREIWKAVRVRSEESIIMAGSCDADRFLLDVYSEKGRGGTGETVDWPLIKDCREYIKKPFLLAGGLKAENIRYAMGSVEPFGIDLSSGIETEGWKDPEKMRQVLEIIRSV